MRCFGVGIRHELGILGGWFGGILEFVVVLACCFGFIVDYIWFRWYVWLRFGFIVFVDGLFWFYICCWLIWADSFWFGGLCFELGECCINGLIDLENCLCIAFIWMVGVWCLIVLIGFIYLVFVLNWYCCASVWLFAVGVSDYFACLVMFGVCWCFIYI